MEGLEMGGSEEWKTCNVHYSTSTLNILKQCAFDGKVNN